MAGSLLAGCAANPAADRPAAVVNTPVSASGTSTPSNDPGGQSRSFEISAWNSTIGFVGSKVTGSHEGSFKTFRGMIELVDEEPTRSRVEVTIDMGSVEADDPDLTDHLKSADFFDAPTYPEASFKSTQIARSDKGYTVTGDLSLHGETRSISFPAEIKLTPEGPAARAEFSIKRFDFKIMYPGKADNLIRDEVLIKLDLKGTPPE